MFKKIALVAITLTLAHTVSAFDGSVIYNRHHSHHHHHHHDHDEEGAQVQRRNALYQNAGAETFSSPLEEELLTSRLPAAIRDHNYAHNQAVSELHAHSQRLKAAEVEAENHLFYGAAAPKRAEVASSSFNRSACDAQWFMRERTKYQMSCMGYDIMKNILNNSATNGGIDGDCRNSCFNKTLAYFAATAACIPGKSIRRIITLTNYASQACKMVGSERCAFKIRKTFDIDCANFTMGTCTTKPQCVWLHDTNECRLRSSLSLLNDLCHHCVFSSLRYLGLIDRNLAQHSILVRSYLCKKVGTHYCLGRVTKYLDDPLLRNFRGNFTHVNRTLNEVCGNNVTNKCFTSAVSVRRTLDTEHAKGKFRRCVSQFKTASPMVRKMACFNPLMDTLTRLEQQKNIYTNMCLRNPDPQHNEYCFVAYNKFFNETRCVADTIRTGMCNATCSQVILREAKKFGCCASVVNNLLNENDVDIRSSAVPRDGRADNNTVTKKPAFNATAAWMRHMLRPFAKCPGIDNVEFQRNATRTCVRPKSNKVVKLTLGLNLAWSVINGSTETKTELLASIVEDLAAQLNLRPDQLVNSAMEQLSTLSVQTNARHFGALSTSTGSSVTADVESDSDEDADTAQSDYNTAVTDGDVDTSTTESTAENECTDSDCTSSDGELVDSSSSSATTVTVTTVAPTTATPGVSGGTTASPPDTTNSGVHNGTTTAAPNDVTTAPTTVDGNTTASPPLDDSIAASATQIIVAAIVGLLALFAF